MRGPDACDCGKVWSEAAIPGLEARWLSSAKPGAARRDGCPGRMEACGLNGFCAQVSGDNQLLRRGRQDCPALEGARGSMRSLQSNAVWTRVGRGVASAAAAQRPRPHRAGAATPSTATAPWACWPRALRARCRPDLESCRFSRARRATSPNDRGRQGKKSPRKCHWISYRLISSDPDQTRADIRY